MPVHPVGPWNMKTHQRLGAVSFLIMAIAQFIHAGKKWGFSSDGKAAFADYNGDGFVDLLACKL